MEMPVSRGLNIRVALLNEAAVLTDIAHAAKRHWGYPEEWITLWRDALTVTPAYLSEHAVFVGEYETERVGFYALLPDHDAWELDHFWIRPAFVGRGFGRALFTHAVTQLKSLSSKTALDIESDPNAESFYLHMGAKRVGEISRDWHGLKRTLPHLRYKLESQSSR
jgi:GNAT superfamily N-acetyltransferase